MTPEPITTSPALADVQRPVADALELVSMEVRRLILTDLPVLEEVGTHLLRMRGKLLRPTLLLLASRAGGAADARAATLAAVVELIHLATLVHDDAVDHSVLRRGMPTVNRLFSHQVSVIAGDYLYSRAVIELVRLRDLEPLDVLSRVTNEMTVGEMRQLTAHDRLAYTEAEYDALIRSKTAALFSGACECGALRAAPRERRALRDFGRALGMAFQITDDVLDYTESEEVTGKPRGLDLKEHKVTLPLIAALRGMTAPERGVVEGLFGSPEPSAAEIGAVVRLVDMHGGLAYARERAAAFAEQAAAELGALPPSAVRDALHAAIVYAVERRR